MAQNKHAYLIMCHNNFSQLSKLLSLLDYKYNDIYIHIDKKAKDYDREGLLKSVEDSKVYFIKSCDVAWGGYSQINVELKLLKAALPEKYEYYHLISGADLPLKTQKTIHEFFESHKGEEFIGVEESTEKGYDAFPRIGQYHFFQDKIGRTTSFRTKIFSVLDNYSMKIQRLMKVNRIESYPVLYKGPQWFSITHQFAEYVVENEPFIRSHFHYGLCVDEMFLQTLAMNSLYAEKVNNNIKRHIDWKRGCPYIWHKNDFNELMASNDYWARKFDERVDSEIIDLILFQLRSI